MFSTWVIVLAGALLLVGTTIPGIRLYWPRHHDPVSRSDLGVALMGGALIAFAVLALQLMIQVRSELDAREREELADRQELLLLLGRSRDLVGLDLHGKDLQEAYLNRKILRGANLVEAKLDRALLEGTVLVAANLGGATLDGADLDRADLRYSDLAGASLVKAKLNGAKLDAASLLPRQDGGKLVRVDLSHADLTNAWIRADLREAILKNAVLVGARLSSANLEGADLTGVNLDYADLRGANLKGANLEGARNINLARDLSWVTWDSGTRWPSDFPPEDRVLRKCAKSTCTLGPSWGTPNPPELAAIRTKLVKATESIDCVPGWWVDERKSNILAHAPGDRARFQVSTGFAGTATAAEFADGVLGRPDKVEEIVLRDVADRSDTYAEHFVSAQGESVLAVYLVRKLTGVRLWALAAPDSFRVFQRDFRTLFRLMGVTGQVFPSLRDEKVQCRV